MPTQNISNHADEEFINNNNNNNNNNISEIIESIHNNIPISNNQKYFKFLSYPFKYISSFIFKLKNILYHSKIIKLIFLIYQKLYKILKNIIIFLLIKYKQIYPSLKLIINILNIIQQFKYMLNLSPHFDLIMNMSNMILVRGSMVHLVPPSSNHHEVPSSASSVFSSATVRHIGNEVLEGFRRLLSFQPNQSFKDSVSRDELHKNSSNPNTLLNNSTSSLGATTNISSSNVESVGAKGPSSTSNSTAPLTSTTNQPGVSSRPPSAATHNRDWLMTAVVLMFISLRIAQVLVTSENTVQPTVPTFPPPPSEPTVGRGCIVPPKDDPTICPLCRQIRQAPAASTGGYVYCFTCLINALEAREVCPVTGIPCRVTDVIRIYEDNRD